MTSWWQRWLLKSDRRVREQWCSFKIGFFHSGFIMQLTFQENPNRSSPIVWLVYNNYWMDKLFTQLKCSQTHGFKHNNRDFRCLALQCFAKRNRNIFIWNSVKERTENVKTGRCDYSVVTKLYLRLTHSSSLPGCLVFQHTSRDSPALTGIVCEEEGYQWICTRLGLPTVPSVASCFVARIFLKERKLTISSQCIPFRPI